MNDSIIMFFIDGVGIGERVESNPFFSIGNLEPLGHFVDTEIPVFANGILVETDACLGVEGRPQSASGQTTIYTGVNAPKAIGRHKQGFPNAELRQILGEKSLFKQLESSAIEPNVFANAYTPNFFEKEPRWKSATTVAVEASTMRFRRLSDLNGMQAVFHDFTNRYLIEKGFDVREFSPEQCADILLKLSEEHRFVLYEHFITDKIGHDQDWDWARRHLPELALFLRNLIEKIDPDKQTVVVTSDHGNLEDLSIRNHTRNKVPTLVWGKHKDLFKRRINSLADITPCIIEALSK